MWDSKMPVHEIRTIRAKTTVYLGAGAIAKMDVIMADLSGRGIGKVLCVTGRGSYRSTGAWDHVQAAFDRYGVDHVLYDRITPNPTVDSVDEAVEMGRDFGAQAVVAIGGGSPIDAAKSAAILLQYPDRDARDLYELRFVPDRAVPVVAVNLTHGTGTEADRFAVVSIPEKDYKPAIAYDCIYPAYAIDDPALMTGLSAEQTRFVSIDALNHVIEAATSKAASPYTVLLARETARLVAAYLPQALAHPGDLTARYHLLYASLIAGIAFDNGLLHFTHALEHPLSAVRPDLAHGLGLSMILPAVIAQIYPACPEVLASLLAPFVEDLKGLPAESERAARAMERWLASVGVPDKLEDQGYGEGDIDRLTDLAMTTPSLDGLLAMAPTPAPKETVAAIYRRSLRPCSR